MNKDNPAYANWHQMWKRSRSIKSGEKRFDNYVKNDVTVHPDFKDFSTWLAEIGDKPEGDWTVGRKDNNGDYAYGNIRWETWAQQARNHSMQRNNTSGETGVQLKLSTAKGKKYKGYIASWYELDGSRKCKHFSVGKYGDNGAFEKATEHRKEMIRRLNAQGADYADTHGVRKD